MKQDVIRRRRTMSFRMIACVHHRREAAGDGRALTAILVAHAIDGGVHGGEGHEAQGLDVAAVRVGGRHVAATSATVVGSATCVADPVEAGIKSGLGGMYFPVWMEAAVS